MRASKGGAASRVQTALEAKAARIAELTQQLIDELRPFKTTNEQSPIVIELAKEADRYASRKNRHGKARGHADSPPISWEEPAGNVVLDFMSDAHLKNLFNGVKRLRAYARGIVVRERKSSGGVPGQKRDSRARDPVYNVKLTDEQRRALKYEVESAHCEIKTSEDGEVLLEWKFSKSTAAAHALNVTEGAISKWRNDDVYKVQFLAECNRELAEALDRRLDANAKDGIELTENKDKTIT